MPQEKKVYLSTKEKFNTVPESKWNETKEY